MQAELASAQEMAAKGQQVQCLWNILNWKSPQRLM